MRPLGGEAVTRLASSLMAGGSHLYSEDSVGQCSQCLHCRNHTAGQYSDEKYSDPVMVIQWYL